MPTNRLSFKFHDVPPTNGNDVRSTNNISGENLPNNVGTVLPENIISENNVPAIPVPIKDDERDLMELMIASSTIPPVPSNTGTSVKTRSDRTSGSAGGTTRSDAKKRAKQQRDLSRDLALLLPDSCKIHEEKAFSFALAYFLKVRDRLDEQSFLEFVKVLSSFDNKSITVCDLYCKVITILEPFCELAEEFVAFLLPEQAMELGIYMEYLCFTKMRHFLQKVEVYFCKQPQQLRKIYECLTRLANQSTTIKIDMSIVRNVMLPLLKGSSLLTEYFLRLFPCEQPPVLECLDNKDFEKVDYGDFDESAYGIPHEDIENWDWETVDIPDLDDPFGGDSCPCTCHYSNNNNSVSSVSAHCFSCGIKFINGRIFIQSGKVLRPAKLVIEGVNKKEIIERIGKKTAVKSDDDKGNSSLRHRKRAAADSSPTKNSCSGNNVNSTSSGIGNSSLLSPTGTESEEDVSDFKPPSAKIKSPRNIKSILKTNHKMVTNKDTEKNCSLQAEGAVLNTRSFVLLDNLPVIHKNNKVDSNDISQENINNIVIKSESCETETDDVHKGLKDCKRDSSLSAVPIRSSSCVSSVVIRDDEDDDIEYIEIDDDDGDDDVDVVDDDDEEDDIEEDEEEITHNDDDEEDYEDIEVAEIDDDEERDMDVDYNSENNDDENICHSDGKADDKNETTDVNGSNKDNPISKNYDYDVKKDNVLDNCTTIKDECSTETLTNDVKMEVDELANKNVNVKNNLSPASDDRASETKSQFQQTVALSSPLPTEVIATDIKDHVLEQTVSVTQPHVTLATSSSTCTSTPTSWTKEEDKVILQTFQQEGDTNENFIMIRKQLPQRSVEEIQLRFNILMQLLKRMTTNKNNME